MALDEQSAVARLINQFEASSPEVHVQPENVHIMDCLGKEYAEAHTRIAMYGDTVRRIPVTYGYLWDCVKVLPRDLEEEQRLLQRISERWTGPISTEVTMEGEVSRHVAEEETARLRANTMRLDAYNRTGRIKKITRAIGAITGRQALGNIKPGRIFPDVIHDTSQAEPYAIVKQSSAVRLVQLSDTLIAG